MTICWILGTHVDPKITGMHECVNFRGLHGSQNPADSHILSYWKKKNLSQVTFTKRQFKRKINVDHQSLTYWLKGLHHMCIPSWSFLKHVNPRLSSKWGLYMTVQMSRGESRSSALKVHHGMYHHIIIHLASVFCHNKTITQGKTIEILLYRVSQNMGEGYHLNLCY